MIKAIKERRSIRKFKSKNVPENIINSILEGALAAPSSKNVQARRLLVIEGVENEKKLTELVIKATKNSEIEEERVNLPRVTDPDYKTGYGAPLFIITLAKNPADCAVMLQNMFLTAHDLGIGSVWINQLNAISNTKEIQQLLKDNNIGSEFKIFGSAAFGYPDELAADIEIIDGQVVRTKGL